MDVDIYGYQRRRRSSRETSMRRRRREAGGGVVVAAGGGSLLPFDSHKSVCVCEWVWKMPLGNCLRVGKLGKWMRPQLSKEFAKQQCAWPLNGVVQRSRCGLVTYINIYKKGRHGRTRHNSSCVYVCVCWCVYKHLSTARLLILAGEERKRERVKKS